MSAAAAAAAEPPAAMPTPLELTLVVAATRTMGIGRAGALPWTGLKKEMAYFARVTKRLPTPPPPPSPSDSSAAAAAAAAAAPAVNAVIMGRKTWESIPPKFRPLKGRLNVVISRAHPDTGGPPPAAAGAAPVDAEPVRVGSLPAALAYLEARAAAAGGSAGGRVFVIGGAQIYAAALELPEARRLLLTRVLSDFDCDTFFPLRPGDAGSGWAPKSKEELDAWAGETVPEGVQEENGTQYEFQMWERVD